VKLHLNIIYHSIPVIILYFFTLWASSLYGQTDPSIFKLPQNRLSIDSLYKLEHRQGFFDVLISHTEEEDSLIIDRGVPVSKIIITSTPATRIPYILKDSIVLKPEDTGPFLNKILKTYNDNGYPFTQMKLTEIRRKDSTIRAVLHINKFERRSIDSIIFYGYERLPRKFFYQKTNIYPGDFFNLSRIRNIPGILIKTGIGDPTRNPELLFTKDSTYLFVYAKKKNDNRFDGILGFSYEGNQNRKLKLTGNVNLSIHNAFNKGEIMDLKWISLTDKLNMLDISAGYPYLWDSPVGVDLNYRIERTDSSSVNNGLTIQTYYSLKSGNTLGFIWQRGGGYDTSNNPTGDTYTYNRYGISYHYIIKRESSSWKFTQLMTYGKRNRENQGFASLKYHIVFPVHKGRNKWIFSGVSAYLYANNYLPNELLKIGGANSLRGFDENNFRATAYMTFSTAFEYALGNQHQLEVFIDTGYLRQLSPPSIWAFGTGLGYSYLIKDGRISLEYAIGNTNLSPFSLTNAKIHLRYLVLF
jgi:outer membrane protein assembly factor BamA